MQYCKWAWICWRARSDPELVFPLAPSPEVSHHFPFKRSHLNKINEQKTAFIRWDTGGHGSFFYVSWSVARNSWERTAAEKAKHLNVVHFIKQRSPLKLFMTVSIRPVYRCPGFSSFTLSENSPPPSLCCHFFVFYTASDSHECSPVNKDVGNNNRYLSAVSDRM